MPWYVIIFWVCGALMVVAAWRWGEWPERVVSYTFMLATIATRLVSPTFYGFHRVVVGIFLIDLTVFGIFLWVSLKSDRWWPIFVTALLTPSLLAHIARWINPEFPARGYSVAGATVYLMIPVIFVGIANQRRRALRISR